MTLLDAFMGPSEMAARMRSVAWESTPLGPLTEWPQSLRSALGICVESAFPIAIYWGPHLTLLYNDAWSSIPGEKHPWALGRPAKEVWPEIWDVIGPLFAQVFATGTATYLQDSLLLMRRHGYTEECYFNYTFTPIRGEGGVIEGVFNAVIETTYRVIAERRSALLRETAQALAGLRSVREICVRSANTLAAPGLDATFTLVYIFDRSTNTARLEASARFADITGIPPTLDLDAVEPWPMATLSTAAGPVTVPHLDAMLGPLPGGAWSEPTHTAIAVPLLTGESVLPSGCLILGASPRRAADDAYVQFAAQAGAHVAVALTSAMAFELERTRAEALAALDRAKTAFFTNVSHEFRTPLTLLLGPLEEALASDSRALQGVDLDACHRNAQRLLRLVNGLLDFVRLESGRVEPRFEPVDLGVLTAEYASTFRAAVERAGLQLRIELSPGTDDVYVDRGLWETVVLNLLSNALKFTFEGAIGVSVSRDGDGVLVHVSDTGVGIAPEHLPKVFDRFFRVDQSRSRTHEGSGIGLALVRELVQLHGGGVEVHSVPGEGTRFTLHLRRGSAHLPSERLRPGGTPEGPQTPGLVAEALRWTDPVSHAPGNESSASAAADHRVLVVDDNADLRDYITRLLSPVCAITAVPTGREALDVLRREAFDLVLTDVMMPGMSGFELLAEIRADARLRVIPILVLSARAGEEARLEGLERGADDYIVKPFTARELVAKTVNQLALARARKELGEERERQAVKLEAARETAERANRAKDEFLAVLGHELRNPLSPIFTAVQLMRLRGQDSREVAVIDRQAKHLTRLVDDLLDVSRVTRGKVDLHRRAVDLAEVVSRAIEMASPLLEQRQQYLELDMTPGLVLDADIDRMAQVLANLLMNASKYSDPGTRITVAAAGHDGRVVISITDRGIGIPRELLDRVFDQFVQQPQMSDRSHGGLGLGLAIARNLVKSHGGTIRAESAGPGQGSRFVIDLPAASMVAARVNAAAERADQPPARRRRVLIVDDNADSAEMLATALRHTGHDVSVALDGPAALDTARRFRPDAALLDIGLPIMDGYELAVRLRADRDGDRPLTLIAVTGYGQDPDRRRSSEAGFEAHLLKPVDLETLEELLQSTASD
jgi:signal transduction histidine kinase